MTKTMLSRLSFVALTALVISACAEGSTPTTPPMSRSTTTATGDRAVPPCFEIDANNCLGSLEPGSYTTKKLVPQITYTVPEGWANLEDIRREFVLVLEGDIRYLGIYQNVRVPGGCDGIPDAGVGGTVDDLVAWYTTHPGLVTTEPEDVTIGELSGVSLDISFEPSWETTCPFSEGQPVVPFMVGEVGESGFFHVIAPGIEERLYILEWREGNVTIEVGAEGTDLDAYLTEVLPIIESLGFMQ